jgi:hypothetical protein
MHQYGSLMHISQASQVKASLPEDAGVAHLRSVESSWRGVLATCWRKASYNNALLPEGQYSSTSPQLAAVRQG